MFVSRRLAASAFHGAVKPMGKKPLSPPSFGASNRPNPAFGMNWGSRAKFSSSSGAGEKRIPLWTTYCELLESAPLMTKAATSCMIVSTGDAVCQMAIEKRKSLDWRRLGNMAIIGGMWVGPALHVWFGFLGRAVTFTGHKATLAMLALDQLVWAPPFIASFVALVMTLEGNPSGVPAALRETMWPALKTNWSMWIPAQLVNFALVPIQFRVLVANIVALFFNTYMSYATHNLEGEAVGHGEVGSSGEAPTAVEK